MQLGTMQAATAARLQTAREKRDAEQRKAAEQPQPAQWVQTLLVPRYHGRGRTIQ